MHILSVSQVFLTLPGSFLETKVTVKRINRGGGYGLKVPGKYHISGQEKAVDWIKRKATTFLQEHWAEWVGLVYKWTQELFACVPYYWEIRRFYIRSYGSNTAVNLCGEMTEIAALCINEIKFIIFILIIYHIPILQEYYW